MEKRGPGRPSSLTRAFLGSPEEQKEAAKARDPGVLVLRALESGCSMKQATVFAGIAERTVYKWLTKGEGKPKSLYGQFVQRVSDAEAKMMSVLTLTIANTATKDWKAAAWLMERRDPERWGRRAMVQLEARVATASVTAFVDLRQALNDPATQRLVDELLSRVGAAEPVGAGAHGDPWLPGPEALGDLGSVLEVVGRQAHPPTNGQHAPQAREDGSP